MSLSPHLRGARRDITGEGDQPAGPGESLARGAGPHPRRGRPRPGAAVGHGQHPQPAEHRHLRLGVHLLLRARRGDLPDPGRLHLGRAGHHLARGGRHLRLGAGGVRLEVGLPRRVVRLVGEPGVVPHRAAVPGHHRGLRGRPGPVVEPGVPRGHHARHLLGHDHRGDGRRQPRGPLDRPPRHRRHRRAHGDHHRARPVVVRLRQALADPLLVGRRSSRSGRAWPASSTSPASSWPSPAWRSAATTPARCATSAGSTRPPSASPAWWSPPCRSSAAWPSPSSCPRRTSA